MSSINTNGQLINVYLQSNTSFAQIIFLKFYVDRE